MKIYLSIPVSSMDEKKQRECADRIKMALSKKGWEVVNPFDIVPNVEKPTWFDHIKANLEALSKCDAIFLCNEWKHSCGCRIENEYAEYYGKKRYFEYVELPQYYWDV